MRKPKPVLLKRPAVLLAVLMLAVLVAVRKVDDLSADPAGEKQCAPLPPAPGLPTLRPVAAPPASETPFPFRPGGTLNDASCLSATPVYGTVQVRDEEDVRRALRFAREHGLKVSVAGVRHSMGGQAFAPNALVLDMTRFNRTSFDEARRVLTAQSGATWHDIQEFLHPRYAVKAMQSTDIFTVGGSISVNAHGMDHHAGAMGRTVRAMRVMLPDGSVQQVSRTENPELFRLVLGGYGLFGVILDADLEVAANDLYEREHMIGDYTAFPDLFAHRLSSDEYGLMYGHLSTAPQSFLREMIIYAYRKAVAPDFAVPPLGEVENVRLRRFVLNAAKLGALPMQAKWLAEKHIEPLLEGCTVIRNQALREGEACLVARNVPMHDSVRYLKNRLPDETDILHEYFIPRAAFVGYVDGLRETLRRRRATLLNASVRVVHPEDAFLNYAPEEMFSIVLYVNQKTDAAGHEQMRALTSDLIDLTVQAGGRFFLPYQLHYSPAQLEQAYPEIRAFFRLKERYDPDRLLTNTLYERFAPALGAVR